MDDTGYKHIPKLPHFVKVLNSRKKCSKDLKPKDVKNSNFLCILHSKPQREYKRPEFKMGDRVRISKSDLPSQKRYSSQFTQETFEKFPIATSKSFTYTKKRWSGWDYTWQILSKRAD